MNNSQVLREVHAERERQWQLDYGVDIEEFDRNCSRNDWVAFVSTYIGRASNAFRNQREGQDFRENMIKAAALCVAAIEAYDKGYC